MKAVAKPSLARLLHRFLFERSPEWVNRMILNDERTESAAQRRDLHPN